MKENGRIWKKIKKLKKIDFFYFFLLTKENYRVIRYKVKTYADLNIGALNKLLLLTSQQDEADKVVNGTWTINGEAKVVLKR